MTNLDIANRFFNALLAGDATELDSLFAKDATFWQNFSGRDQHRDNFLPGFAKLVGMITDLQFENVRRIGTASGFVEQHTLRGTTASGAALAAHGCFIAQVKDGKIDRVEEYLDGAQLAPLVAPRGAQA